MDDEVQSIIDGALYHMRSVSLQRCASPAATRVLYSFVIVLARQLLTQEQRQQVETLLDLHEDCVSR